MQFDPNHLSALAAILRLGSFEAAALELRVTPSAISQRIKAFEERVGAALITRGTPCTGTPQGVRLAKHAEDVGLLEAQLARDLSLSPSQTPTRIRIAVTADSLATWFPHAMAAQPDLLFDLVVDDQDHSADWLKRGAVSAAITASAAPVPGCDAYPLGALRYLATASPAFMAQWFADGVDNRSLARAPCMVFNAKDGLQRQWLQARIGHALAPPSHVLPSSHAFVDAARLGLGWGMNPADLAQPALDRGELMPLIPDTPLDVPLIWQVSRVMAQALAPLTQAVRRTAARRLIALRAGT